MVTNIFASSISPLLLKISGGGEWRCGTSHWPIVLSTSAAIISARTAQIRCGRTLNLAFAVCHVFFFFERIRVHKKWKQVERYIASYRSVCVCGGGVIVEIYLRSKWMDFFSPRHTYTYSRSQTRFHLCPRRFTMIVQREIFEKLMFAEYRDVSSSLCANFPSLNCAMCTDYFKFVS